MLINMGGGGGVLELPSVNALKNAGLAAALDKYRGAVKLSVAKHVQLVFAPQSSQTKTMLGMTKFLKFASSFAQNA